VNAEDGGDVLAAMRAVPAGRGSQQVGYVTEAYEGRVALRTQLGTHRLLQMLSGEQLPRIC
ncbi:MAG: hydrogenase expression/formation protein HypE, partial [Xanthomonadales bacterium]|nr:hydrogenase expression/formation protein HypE [Xanthomonadales bacterium]NIO13063.1 hydrogenase expression/formation protein HypE [Xanthomonadales bacterium]